MGGGRSGRSGRWGGHSFGARKREGVDGDRARPVLADPVERDLDADLAQESRGAAQFGPPGREGCLANPATASCSRWRATLRLIQKVRGGPFPRGFLLRELAHCGGDEVGLDDGVDDFERGCSL